MKNILKSFFDTASNEVTLYLEELLSLDLTEQEGQYLDCILQSYNTLEKAPTETIFIQKFPETEIMLSDAKQFFGKDLQYYIEEFIAKRRNKETSSFMMDMANNIAKYGLSEDHIMQLQARVSDSKAKVDESSYSLTNFRERYQKRKTMPTGLITGVREIDEIVHGLNQGTVNTIFAYTSQGKSLFGCNILYKNSVLSNYNTAVISLEVTKEEIYNNLLGLHSSLSQFDKYDYLPHDKIKYALLSDEEEAYLLDEVAEDFENNKKGMLFVLDEDDFQNFSYTEIRRKLYEVDDICMQKTGSGLDALLIDHIGLFKFSDNSNSANKSEYSIINDYTSFFRRLTLAFRKYDDGQTRQLTTILLAQANRKGFEEAVKKTGAYSLTAIAEANEIERSSYRIFSLWTNDELKMAKETMCCILKNRGGRTVQDPMPIYFDGARYLIGQLEGTSTPANGGANVMDFLSSDNATSDDFDNMFGDDLGDFTF